MKKSLNLSGRYCLYLRKSRADRENIYSTEEDVLSRHEHILMSLAKSLHISITKIFREVVSGDTVSSRPEVQKLLTEVEEGLWDGVLVVEVERLARGDTIDQGVISRSFTYSRTLIITPTKIYDPEDEYDSEYFEFGLFMSRREYKTINRRLQRGREQSAVEGKYTGNIPPYGYERVKLKGEKGYTLSPLPEQADIVRLIFDMYVNGDGDHQTGVSRIVRKLNDLHIATAKGGDWTNASVQGILENPVYMGMIRYKWRSTVKSVKNGTVSISRPRKSDDAKLFPGRHPALITPELFHAAQSKRKKNPSRPVPSRYIVQNPLSGIVVCAKCGRKMVRRPCGQKHATELLICYHTNCPQVGSPLYLVEQEIIRSLRSIIDTYTNPDISMDHIENNISANVHILENTQKELQTLLAQKDRLYDFLEQGIYTTEIFLDRSASLSTKISQTEKAIESLQDEIQLAQETRSNRSAFVPKCEHLLAHYDEMTIAQKNSCLKELITKVVYDKNEKNKRGTGDRPNFFLHLYPQIFYTDD